jgi:putative cell wall-binding protein
MRADPNHSLQSKPRRRSALTGVACMLALFIPVAGFGASAAAVTMPVAVDDHYATTQSAPVETIPNVLSNDDMAGSSYFWLALTTPTHGMLSRQVEVGHFTYSPNPGFSGTDSMQYCLTRNLPAGPCNSNVATIVFTVATAVANDDLYATPAGTQLIVTGSGALGNDLNVGTGLGWTFPALPAHGTFAPSGSGAFTYTPDTGFAGTDSFQYCLVDLAGPCQSNVATVSINVNLPPVTRISGSDRFEMAIAIADRKFPTTAPVVFVASGTNFPDALSAAPAAAELGGPVLLTRQEYLPEPVGAKIATLKPSSIVVVGGPNSISEAVVARLKALVPGATVQRLSGADRYAVSRAVVDYAFDSAAQTYVTTGATFADALSAGSAAASAGVPLLLVNGATESVDAATRSLLSSLSTSSIRIVGGVNSVSVSLETSLASIATVTRTAGADRFEASVNLNRAAFPSAAATIYLATGYNYPDALAGGVLAGTSHSPLYVIPTDCVPREVMSDIIRLGAREVVLLGGPNSLNESVARLQPCSW